MRRNILFYTVALMLFAAGVYFLLAAGRHLRPGNSQNSAFTQAVISHAQATGFGGALTSNLQQPLSILLLQVIVIVAAARWFGMLFNKIGQPSVIGEMIAGIILGPSLLGALFPTTQSFLFPPASMDLLKALSQLGVILFMFVVGLDLNVQHLRLKAHTAVLVSHAGIMMPF
jgi:predicted permease